MKYKALIISGALLAAPLAFAQDNSGGQSMPPPPPPLMQGQPMMIQGEHDGMGSSTPGMHHGGPMRPVGYMGTSTDGRPPMGREMHGGMMGSSTPDMDHGNPMMGTSTPPGPHGVAGFFAKLFGFMHGGNGTSTPPAPMMNGGMASTSMDSSSTPPAPQGIAGFFQHFFSLFH